MTDFPESHRDLLDAQVGVLGTVDSTGTPQLSATWFLYDGGELKISLNTGRAKYRNLRARPQCSLLILDLQNPYRYLEARGRAEIEEDPDYTFAGQVGAKYGADVRQYDAPGTNRVVVTLRPEKVYPVDMSG